MAKLKKLESIVEKILEENKDARENDDILYLYVCEYFNEEAPLMPLRSFLKLRKEMSCPVYESVSRARRKAFEKRPELKEK
jgi:hypothetical protein